MKTNIKHYSEKTKQSLFNQLHSLIPEKHNGLQNIVDVCEDIITNGDDNMQYWFINVFSKIIHETGIYYNCLPKNVRHYYRDTFIEKINSKFFKHLENSDFFVKIVTSMKPILAVKDDILVNEGDVIEDIIFIKKLFMK